MDEAIEKVDEAAKVEPTAEKKSAPSIDDLQKQIDELTRHAKNKEEEAARVQKKLEKFQADEDARKKAELSEIDRLKLERQEALTKAEQAEAILQAERTKNLIYAEASKPQFGDKKYKFLKPDIAYQLLTDEEKSGDVLEGLKRLAKENDFLLEKPTASGDGVGSPARSKTKSNNSEAKQDYKIPRI